MELFCYHRNKFKIHCRIIPHIDVFNTSKARVLSIMSYYNCRWALMLDTIQYHPVSPTKLYMDCNNYRDGKRIQISFWSTTKLRYNLHHPVKKSDDRPVPLYLNNVSTERCWLDPQSKLAGQSTVSPR